MGASRRLLARLKEQKAEEAQQQQHTELTVDVCSSHDGAASATADASGASDARSTPDAPSEPSTRPRRRNRKNRRREKHSAASARPEEEDDDDDNNANARPSKSTDGEGVYEVEQALQELADLGFHNSNSSEEVLRLDGKRTHSPLRVDLKHLRPEAELRRLFGSHALRDHPSRRSESSSSRRIRKAVFTAPKDSWPPYKISLSNGLAMEVVDRDARATTFRFLRGYGYEKAQAMFSEVRMGHDPNALILLLQRLPYHTDALMVTSDLTLESGEPQRAADLLERALHSFERVLHPSFTKHLSEGTARMDSEEPLNKPFMEALMRHGSALLRRGCPRTSLEVLKALLSLDRGDPQGTLLLLDHAAIRCSELAWLLELFDGDADNGCALAVEELPSDVYTLPNLVFNLPLARWLAGRIDRDHVVELLAQAVLMYPDAISDALWQQHWSSSQEAHPQWRMVLRASLFEEHKREPYLGSATLAHCAKLFALRNQRLWLDEPHQTLLLDGARRASELYNSEDSIVSDMAQRARESFPHDEGENELRHLEPRLFSDDVSQALPEGMGFAGAGQRALARDAEVGGGDEEEAQLQHALAQAIDEAFQHNNGGNEEREVEQGERNEGALEEAHPRGGANGESRGDRREEDGSQGGVMHNLRSLLRRQGSLRTLVQRWFTNNEEQRQWNEYEDDHEEEDEEEDEVAAIG